MSITCTLAANYTSIGGYVLPGVCLSVCLSVGNWWDWSLILRTYLPSVLWHRWLGLSTRKTRPRYDL